MTQKRKSDGGGIGPHVRALRGGRTDFDPAVLRTVWQWLVMINERYHAAERAAAGRHDHVNAAVKMGIRKRYSQLAEAAMIFLADARAPWSRVAWLEAGAALDKLICEAAAGDDNVLPAFFGDACAAPSGGD